eukprot:COSAG02_NODE_2507_length_8637_cov_2.877138_2_plen_66_part_00
MHGKGEGLLANDALAVPVAVPVAQVRHAATLRPPACLPARLPACLPWLATRPSTYNALHLATDLR